PGADRRDRRPDLHRHAWHAGRVLGHGFGPGRRELGQVAPPPVGRTRDPEDGGRRGRRDRRCTRCPRGMRRRLGQAKRRPNTKPNAMCSVGSSLTLDPTYISRARLLAALAFIAFPLAPAFAQPAALPSEQPSAAEAAPAKSDRRAAGQQRRARPGNLIGHGGPIKALAVDAGTGRALTGSFDYAMMVWDVGAEVPVRLHRLDDHNGAVNAVAFVPGGKLALAAGDDGAVAVWDLATGKLAHRFAGHTAKVAGLAVSADGRWAASASWDRTARLWDLGKLAPGPALEGHQGPVNAVAFSADGTRVYSAS